MSENETNKSEISKNLKEKLEYSNIIENKEEEIKEKEKEGNNILKEEGIKIIENLNINKNDNENHIVNDTNNNENKIESNNDIDNKEVKENDINNEKLKEDQLEKEENIKNIQNEENNNNNNLNEEEEKYDEFNSYKSDIELLKQQIEEKNILINELNEEKNNVIGDILNPEDKIIELNIIMEKEIDKSNKNLELIMKQEIKIESM